MFAAMCVSVGVSLYHQGLDRDDRLEAYVGGAIGGFLALCCLAHLL